VQPGQKLFELVLARPVEVEFSLPESDASRLVLGLPLDVGGALPRRASFHATVSMISPIVDERTHAAREGALPNPDGRLRPDCSRTDLGIAKRENVVLRAERRCCSAPTARWCSARSTADEGPADRDSPGRIKAGEAEVASGLEAGDSVVVRGHAALIDGAAVSARNADGTPAVAASAPEDAKSDEVTN
jgi:membrane fusion protein (multidrug efflux system)